MSPDQLFLILAFAVGALVFGWSVRESKPDASKVWLVAFVGAVSGVVGAKLTEMIFHGWPLQMPPLLSLDPETGGRALWGGMCLAFIGVELTKRAVGIRGTTIDSFVLAIPVVEIVGRISCILNGCCYGETSTQPWAIFQHDAWRHPTQFYSMITAGIIFCALFAIRKRIAYEGQLFLIFLLLFGASRFFIEEFRWQSGNNIMGMTAMQWFCIDMMSIGAVRLIRHHVRHLKRQRAAS